MPEDLLRSFSFKETKEDLDILLILMKNNNFSLDYFISRFTQLFDHIDQKIKTINVNTFEKIRFFMNFVNKFPNYITETEIPNETKNKIYSSLYSSWGRTKSYFGVYNKYIKNAPGFFRNHIEINAIPNYPRWNLNILLCTEKNNDLFPYETEVPLYPLQVFENMDGTFNSMLFLMPQNDTNKKESVFKDYKVQKFSIINNFSIFAKKNKSEKSIKLELASMFESYTEFIDNYNKNKEQTLSDYKTYEFYLDFKRKYTIDISTNSIKNKETIQLFNRRYKEKINFGKVYSSITSDRPNPYRVLFKNRYVFPDFKARENYILTINKKKNVLFEKTIEFFKLWTYQTIVYELKNKIVIYGFLPTGFNYNSELPFIHEVLDRLETEYTFLVNNRDFKQSTLSLYFLPSSNQFVENTYDWKFNTYNLPLSITQKENIITSQIKADMQ